VQSSKQSFEIVSTDGAIQIDASDEHARKADSPKTRIAQPGSNDTFERLLQELKQELGIVSTDDGIQID
jgi:hypothetical protein